MKAKNLMVFFLAMASILLMASSFVVAQPQLATIEDVKVDGYSVKGNNTAVIAGDEIFVDVKFTAKKNASDVVVEATLEGKETVEDGTGSFPIENGSSYSTKMIGEKLFLKIPYEFQDEVSKKLDLEVEIRSGGDEASQEYSLNVQRPSYNADVMSIESSSSVDAGKLYPVEIVLKNTGYNKLNNMYVTASIPGLEVERTFYMGDIVAIENCSSDDCDLEDTLRGTVHLEIPYRAPPGEYTLSVEGENEDMKVSDSKKITVKNDLPKQIVVSQSRKTVEVGEETSYELTIANPTNSLKVYRVVTETTGEVSASVDSSVISIPGGTTKTVTVTAEPSSEGEHSFKVGVLSGEGVVESVELSMKTTEKSRDNSIVALTIALAVIFVVLVVVLIVLLGKKPKKQTEDFGESYY